MENIGNPSDAFAKAMAYLSYRKNGLRISWDDTEVPEWRNRAKLAQADDIPGCSGGGLTTKVRHARYFERRLRICSKNSR